MQFGLSLLQAIKEEVGIRPSRKSLDFLLSACVITKDSMASFLIWKEYETAGLQYNVLSLLRMYQALLASGERKSAEKLLNKMPKFFSLLPGEIVLASLDGFNKVFDAVEVAGKNVMSTTSVVTTGLVSQKYGEQAAQATHDGLGAAGHAIGTAWAVFKIRKALNPKSVFKPTTIAKAAAEAKLKSK